MSLRETVKKLGATVDLGPLREQRRHVMVVVPLSPEGRGGEPRKYTIEGNSKEQRETLFRRFVDEVRPMLAEVDADNPDYARFGLRKLMVPGVGLVERASFVLRPDNYFFRRAAANSEHPFWKRAEGTTDTDWLKAHRGKNFILEVRQRLRTFLVAQPWNATLINAFMVYLAGFKGMAGLGNLAIDVGFPPGLAEKFLDFFYLGLPADGVRGSNENDTLGQIEKHLGLGAIDWSAPDKEGFRLVSNPKDGVRTLARLAEEFRRTLLGKAPLDPSHPLVAAGVDSKVRALDGLDKAVADFRKAQEALLSLVEMLPSRVLPQESLAWLLEELFDLAGATRDPQTTVQYNQVARAVSEGVENVIKAPTNPKLALEQRDLLRAMIEKGIDQLVVAFRDGLPPKSLDASLRPVYTELRKNSGVMQFLKALLPSGDDVPSSLREAFTQGTQRFLRTMLLSQVVPRMFSIPVVTERELMTVVQGCEFGCVLTALAMAQPEAGEKLGELGDQMAAEIGEHLKKAGAGKGGPVPLSKDACQSVVGQTLCRALPVLAESLGERMAEDLAAWQEAQRILALLEPPGDSTLVSSFRNLRAADAGGAVANSPSHANLREAVRAVLSARQERARVVDEWGRQARAVAEGKAKLESAGAAEQVMVAAKERVQTEKELAEGRKSLEKLRPRLEEFRAGDVERKTAPPNLVGDRIERLLDAMGMTEAAIPASDQEVPAEAPAKGGLANLTGRELEARIDELAGRLSGEQAEVARVREVLAVQERLNAAVYRLYAEKIEDTTLRPYHRQVEALAFSRVLLANRKRVGVGGSSSGLLRALLDLVEKTGVSETGEVRGVDVLSTVSLHEYLDGGLLAKGQDIVTLRQGLEGCARESLQNICGLVSELQGLYFLFRHAPVGSVVSVFNGTAGEFFDWVRRDNLGDGGGTGAFRVVTNPMGNARAASICRPGWVYISRLAVPDGFQPGVALSDAVGRRCLVPPMLVSDAKSRTALGGIPAPVLEVGPDFPLNPPGDALASYLPAAIPVLAGFLGAKDLNLTLRLNEQAGAPSNGRYRCVAGLNKGIEVQVEEALVAPDAGHAFAGDYFLYVVLALYADARAGAKQWDSGTFFDVWWDNPRTRGWSGLSQEILGSVALNDCFLAPLGAPSACRFRFSANYFQAQPPGTVRLEMVRPGTKEESEVEAALSDFGWFVRAGQSLFPGQFP